MSVPRFVLLMLFLVPVSGRALDEVRAADARVWPRGRDPVGQGGAARLGERAPDFELPLLVTTGRVHAALGERAETVRLSTAYSQRPVVLIFSSFT